MELTNALDDLGVNDAPLLQDQAHFLDANGYLVIENVLSLDQVENVKNRIDEILTEEGLSAGCATTTPLRQWLNRPNAGILKMLFGYCYDALFRAVRLTARLAFKFLPDLQASYRSPDVLPRIRGRWLVGARRELQHMIATEASQECRGVVKVHNLVNKGETFQTFFSEPRVLAAVRYVLCDDFKLSSLNFRSARPGNGRQSLHVDWGWAVRPDQNFAANTLWMLEDATECNGATRVVPGSHRWPRLPQDDMEDPRQPHPNEKLILAKAGSVVVLNSHTWHGGTRNESGSLRPIIQGYFVHSAHAPQLCQPTHLRPDTRRRLNWAALTLLGVASTS